MNELDLPTAPPLTEEVSERALATVRAGMRRPPARRAPYVAAAAAVITTLLVSTLVVAGLSRSDIDVATPPSALLARCAAAVTNAGRAADYPPVDTWRVTADLLSGSREQAIAINDAFACHADATSVRVTAVHGVAAGGVEIVRLAPTYLAVLNPTKLGFQVERLGFGTAPVTLVRLGRALEPAADFHLTVVADTSGPELRRSWDGPMPEPSGIAVVEGSPAPPAAVPDLDACLTDNMPTDQFHVPWQPVLRRGVPGHPVVAVGRIGDVVAGFCFADPAGPIYAEGYLPPVGGLPNPGIVASIRGADSARIVLVAVPADTTGATIGPDTPCQVQDGLALCTAQTADPLTVTVHGRTATELPVR